MTAWPHSSLTTFTYSITICALSQYSILSAEQRINVNVTSSHRQQTGVIMYSQSGGGKSYRLLRGNLCNDVMGNTVVSSTPSQTSFKNQAI